MSRRITIPSMSTSPLHLLAHVALDTSIAYDSDDCDHVQAHGPFTKAGPSYTPTRNAGANLHIECSQPATTFAEPSPLKRSSASNSPQSSAFSFESKRRTKLTRPQTRKSSRVQQRAKAEVMGKRRERMTQALKIITLENSPVNSMQHAVLRMIYNKITAYPPESWMVLTAITIHRSFKQVKNWFSNERQKQKAGEVVSTHTDVGEKIRLCPQALQHCQEWSDNVFEGVIRIYYFKLLCDDGAKHKLDGWS
ncbi:hypothetical protein Hypma_015702 [Hypsizygus marmoreus]|uniref:Homeobox domain-containing protein n=1 Tax=Hypsizygus marmoreus TaxID=39966 RepID=A0A369K6K7_HYPMA|nr:hypothetical protein Hypma_015702 [Hypsizygus marmoreus]